MFTRILISFGWLGILVGVLYFVLNDRSAKAGEAETYIARTQQIVIVSALAVVAGYGLRILEKILGTGAGRCRKCGKRIHKGEMFCFDHRQEAIWDAKERHRIDGGGPVRNHVERR